MQGAQVWSLVQGLDPTCHNWKILHVTNKTEDPHAATETSCSQINKYFKKKKSKPNKELGN